MSCLARRSLHRRRAGVALALVLVGAASVARADERSAAESFRVGTAAYALGDYRAAALAFEACYREQAHAASLYNAGQSWAAAGALPRAADAYAAALRAEGLNEAQATSARAHLRAYETSLGRVEVTAPAGTLVALEHVDRASAPLLVHVTPGEHAVRAVLADGQAITKIARVGPGERITITFPTPAKQEQQAPPASQASAPRGGEARPHAGPSGLLVLGWSAIGGAGLAGGAAIFLGARGLAARDAFDASGHTDQAARDRAASLRVWTNVTWATAGALGAAGVVLLLVAPSRPAVKASVSLGGAAVSGSF